MKRKVGHDHPEARALSEISKAALLRGAFELPLEPPKFAYLAGVLSGLPEVHQLQSTQGPAFEGTPDEFISQFADEFPDLRRQLKNKVRKCACGKPVAFTLSTCNGCGADLSEVPISFTNNVFSSFLYGIRKGPFPFTISLRLQTPELMVFDDLLALTPCHLNTIPTSTYIPDWRYLLRDPAKGLEILQGMYDGCWSVVASQFLTTKGWQHSVMGGTEKLSGEELKKFVVAGFNYPPSQYQLHLQFMLMPLLPFQYYLYQQGVHYTKGRFVPLEYALRVLALNQPFDVKEDTPQEAIFAYYKEHGVDYDEVHDRMYASVADLHTAVAQWDPVHFKAVVVQKGPVIALTAGRGMCDVGGSAEEESELREKPTSELKALLFKLTKTTVIGNDKEFLVAEILKRQPLQSPLQQRQQQTEPEQETLDAAKQVNVDKEALQNYGRPYKDGKPSGSYYKFPKHPSQVQAW